jgi:GT2 family glycosyltransferase
MVEPRVFSIVIPTFGRPDKLRACLEALTRLDYPGDRFEVVVVDDGNDVALEPVVAAVRGRVDVTLLRRPHGGAAAARNSGAARARGRLLAFTDDDCAPAPDWLDKLGRRFARAPSAVMIGGRTVNALTGNVYSTASQLVVDAGYAHLNGNPGRARFLAAANLALPAEAFRALGGFDESFVTSEDRELCGRWESRGHRMVYAPEAIVYHAHDLTLTSFWRQHFAYGRGAFLMQQARARHGWEQFRPDPGYYARLLRTPFSRTSRVAAVRLAALLLVSQSASAAGLIAEWARQRRATAAAGAARR